MRINLFRCLIITLFCCGIFSCQKPTPIPHHSVFRYNEHANITSLDPAFAKDQRNIWACHQLYNTLVKQDAQLNIKADLAKSWTISNEAKTYTFTLRDSVFFHPHAVFGKDSTRQVTAEDVVYSLKRLTSAEVGSPGSWVLDQLEAIKVIDNKRVQIQLKQSFPAFLGVLSMKYCAIVPKESQHLNLRKTPIGTGPFYLKAWLENEKMVLRKHKRYFETDSLGQSLPYLEAVAITFLPDKQSEFMAFIQGELDFLNALDPSYKDELLNTTGELQDQYSDQINLEKSPYLNTEYIGINMESNQAGLQNKWFRQALNVGFDRQKMIKYLRNGIGTPATNGFIPKGLPGYLEEPIYTFDKKLALSYLKRYKNETGLAIPELKITTNANYLDLVEFIQKSYEQIGIATAIEVLPPSTIRQQRSAGQLDLFRASWIADYPDAENYLGLFYSPKKAPNGPNYTRYENAKFDSLYVASQRITKDSLRQVYYKQMNKLVSQHAPVIPLYYDQVTRFYHKNVKGLKMNPVNLLDLKTVYKTK